MKVLVVVDMQNDFIDGPLGTPEAVDIVENVRKKIGEYRQAQETVIFTRDTHGCDYSETQEGRRLPVEHCIKGTYGWEISSALDIGSSPVIDKPAFGSVKLTEMLKEMDEKHHLESIELIGVCTDICVISNAVMIKSVLPEVCISVDSSCCAGVTPQSHETALRAMEMCQIDINNNERQVSK